MVIYYNLLSDVSITINNYQCGFEGFHKWWYPQVVSNCPFQGLVSSYTIHFGVPTLWQPMATPMANHPGKRMKSAIWHFLGNYMEL
jgi:hypothetical protein